MRNYLLLTPGPLSTSQTVREAMLQDWCTWDKDYNEGIVTPIRKGLLAIAGLDGDEYTSPEASLRELFQMCSEDLG